MTATRPAGPSNLQLRLATAAVGLPLLALVVWIGGWPFAGVASIVVFVGALEFVHGWLTPERPMREAFRLWAVPAAAAATVLFSHLDTRTALLAGLLALFCAAVGYAPLPFRVAVRPYRVAAWCLLYVGILFSASVLLRDLRDGREWFFLAMLATFATDTGAYATGRLLGRRPLAPRISPKKTVEGAIGGFVAGCAAVVALGALLSTEAGVVEFLLLGLLLPLAAIIGDLLESWVKRRMGVKDASGLLPGHGGMLDRMDSVLLTVPLTYLFVRYIVA